MDAIIGMLAQYGPGVVFVGLLLVTPLAYTIRALITGRLVPVKQVEREQLLLTNAIERLEADRDGWKLVATNITEVVGTLSSQVDRLVADGTVHNQLLTGIKDALSDRAL